MPVVVLSVPLGAFRVTRFLLTALATSLHQAAVSVSLALLQPSNSGSFPPLSPAMPVVLGSACAGGEARSGRTDVARAKRTLLPSSGDERTPGISSRMGPIRRTFRTDLPPPRIRPLTVFLLSAFIVVKGRKTKTSSIQHATLEI